MSAQINHSRLEEMLYGINFFTLLGLSLPQKEQDEITFELARASISAGLEKYIIDNNVSDQTLSSIEEKFNRKLDSVEAQEYISQKFPGIEEYIKWAAVDLKKKALFRQVNDLLEKGVFNKNPQTKSHAEMVCSGVIKALRQNDQELFEKSFSEYELLKANI